MSIVKRFLDFTNESIETESGMEDMSNSDSRIDHESHHESPHYMFFGNLETIKNAIDKMLLMDPKKIADILENGHDWAADHIATSKDDVEEVYNFLRNEMAEDAEYEELDEKKRLKWHDSDSPDANGKFKELGINALADWLIRTRGRNMQKITGSLNQQINFNKNKNPGYAKKMEKTREAVKRKLGKEKDSK